MSPQVVFLHIPKSAGTSQRQAFYDACGRDNVFWLGTDCPPSPLFYPQRKVSGKSIMGGHKGIRFYPKKLSPLYCAIVRDPVERAISLYSYYTRPDLAGTREGRFEREKQLQRWLKKGIDAGSLINTIENCRAFRKEISNLQCRYLSRGKATFEAVKASVDDNDFLIGSASYVDKYSASLASVLGFGGMHITSANRSNGNYRERLQIDQEVIDCINSYNVEDTKLFNFINNQPGQVLQNIEDVSRYKLVDVDNKQKVGSRRKKVNAHLNHKQREILIEAEKYWGQGGDNNLQGYLRTVMFSQQHKVIYAPIAKCACTSLKSMMVDLAGVNDKEKLLNFGVHLITDRFNTGVHLKDIDADTALSIVQDRTYFSFAVMRDPTERLVSAYLEKFVFNRDMAMNQFHTSTVLELFYEQNAIDHKRGVSFRQFIEVITQQKPRKLDGHWKPQHLSLEGVENMTKIYDVDHLSTLQQDLSSHTGLNITINHENKTDQATQPRSNVDGYIVDMLPEQIEGLGSNVDINLFKSPDIVSLIKDYYAKDFELFETHL